MKSRFLKIVRFLCAVCLNVSGLMSHSAAQMPLGLSVKMNEGQARLTVTGGVGKACQLQWTDNLSATGRWFHLGHLILKSPPSSLVDSNASSTTLRYYRAIWTPNTNLVWIPPGTFTMGSPLSEYLRAPQETQHLTTISRGFWMGNNLVTQRDYLSVVGNNPSHFTAARGYSDDLTRPVKEVNWFDAANYCSLRTQQERVAGLILTNYVYRLPTEAEWEYACRAGTMTAFYSGSGLYSGQANFDGEREYDAALGEINNSSGIFLGKTVSVGSYAANAWRLYDMNGNVWEWCQDWYEPYPTGPVTDPQGAASGYFREWRGGSWGDYARYCRSAQRGYFCPDYRNDSFGIRVVLSSDHAT
jgi:formylglycine-generating enzyme required for sulfatase activity